MRALALLAALLLLAPQVQAHSGHGALAPVTQSGITPIGVGCSTFSFIDHDCDGCGVGVQSGGSYPVVTGTLPVSGATPWWSMGNQIDADDTDPTVCTTAQWQAKWGTTNANMVTFIQAKKGFTNTGSIYYLATSGNDSTAVVNDPTHPFATMACIETGGSSCNNTTGVESTTSAFTGSATLASGSSTLTVTVASTGTLLRTYAITGTDIPASTFVIAQLTGTDGSTCPAHTCTGGVGTYWMTANALGTVSSAESVTGSYQNGGVIIIRAGSWTTNAIQMAGGSPNPSWNLSGSYGHPLLIMNYPGEVVFDGYQNSGGVSFQGTGYAPLRAACCVTIDGLQFSAPTFYTGYAVKVANFEDLTVQNSEFAGQDDGIEAGPNVKNIKIINNVFHEVAAHGVYITGGVNYTSPNYGAGECSVPAAGDFNFAQDQANYLAGNSCGAIYNINLLGNVFYDSGDQGLDPMHLNAYLDGAEVHENVVSYSGGSGIDLQTGDYNDNISANIVFDVGSYCFEEFLDSVSPEPLGAGNAPATHRWNTFQNNVCYLTDPANTIWGKQPISGFLQQSGVVTINGSLSGTTMTVTSKAGTDVGVGMTVVGTGIPASTTILAYGTNGTSGTGATGTYALSQAVTTEGTESITAYNPLATAVSDMIFTRNIVVTTDNNGSLCSGCTNSVPFDFEYNTYPETDTISRNTFWSAGSTNHMMYVVSNASTATTIGAGAYDSFSGGTGCNASTGSFSNCYPSNTYAGSNPFSNASSAIYQTPGAFNFSPHNLH